MNTRVIGLVGGTAGGDAGSGELVAELGMPVVATAISESFQNSPTVFDINPPFADINQPIGKFRFLYDQGVRKAAIVLPAADQTRSEAVKQRAQMEAAGIEVVLQQEVPVSTLSFDSAARAVANSGAQYLLFISDASQSASMARSMADTGYDLQYPEYLVAYGSNFIELAGDAAERAISWTRTLPNEEAGPNAEQNAFLEWMDRTSPGVVADGFAADSWVAAKAMVDTIAALPGPITREGVLAALRATETYDAGGMLGPIRLGAKLNNGCFVGMVVDGGAWRRLAPAQGFLC